MAAGKGFGSSLPGLRYLDTKIALPLALELLRWTIPAIQSGYCSRSRAATIQNKGLPSFALLTIKPAVLQYLVHSELSNDGPALPADRPCTLDDRLQLKLIVVLSGGRLSWLTDMQLLLLLLVPSCRA